MAATCIKTLGVKHRKSHGRRITRQSLMLAGSTVFASMVHAASYSFLTHPDLVGLAAVDAYLGNGNDESLPGLNNYGHASQFSDSNGSYGFFGGFFHTEGETLLGNQWQAVIGQNHHTLLSNYGEWNNDFIPSYNNYFTQSLNTDTPSVVIVNADQTYTSSFVLNDSAFNGRVKFTGSGHYLLKTQTASAHYSDDLLAHFNFVTPLLPDNWASVAHEIQTYEVLDGIYAGTTGASTLTFYTQDQSGIPAAQPFESLGAPWDVTGFALGATDGSSVIVGSQETSPVSGTATLNGGDAVSTSQVSINSGSVTVDGVDTQLTVIRPADFLAGFGSISAGGNGDAALQVSSGATVTTSQIIGIGQGEFSVAISGSGSTLNLGCTAQDCSPAGFIGLFDGRSLFSGNSKPGSTAVTQGGMLTIAGKDNTGAGVQVHGNHVITVDGQNSIIEITGSPNVAPGGASATGVGVDDGAVLHVANGGEVKVHPWVAGRISGVAAGSVSPATGYLSVIIVEDAASIIDAGALFTAGELFQFDANLNAVVDKGAGGHSVVVVRDGGLIKATDILIGLNGTLKGSGGTLQGTVENRGVVAPGESPGVLNIEGDYTQASPGTLIIEIAGVNDGEYDVLNVSGKFTAGGTLKIELLDGFVPTDNDNFQFLIFDTFAGEFGNVVLPTFGNGKTFALNFGPNGIGVEVTAVPLPAGLPLLLSALAAMGAIRRRKLPTSSAR